MSGHGAGTPREPRSDALRYWIADHKVPVFGWSLILVMLVAALGAWGAGIVNPSPIAQPRTSFGTEGANLVEKGGVGTGVEVGAVGKGLTRTYIIRATGARGPQPTVIFLHGFGSSIIAGYEPWLEHLAKEGMTVIFPSWQQPPFPIDGSQNPRTNMFAGVRLALDAVPVIKNQIAAVGLSAGAALAFDYAALATSQGLPPARLVYSVYPGRAFPGQTKPILPIPSIAGLAPDAKVVTLVSRKDEEVGTRWGKQQYRALASRPANLRQLVYVEGRGLMSHYSPAKTIPAARKMFWKRLDTLLTVHLGARPGLDADLRESIRAERKVKKTLRDQSLFRKQAEAGADGAPGE